MTLRCKERPLETPTRPLRIPDHSDWARLRPEIEHLYIRKRYKLRHIIQHVERSHGLQASVQMYKKRFARWGLEKNSRRSTPSQSDSEPVKSKRREVVQADTCQCKSMERISRSPHLSKQHRLTLIMLKGVKIWSTSYFEIWHSTKGLPSSTGQYPIAHPTLPQKVNDFVFALKLVNNLLSRGHGQLAGRVTRKAFLMLEDAITLDPPALIWNILEIMHHMILLRQDVLCEMLLIYLSALVDCKMTKSHPLSAMLHTVKELLAIHATVDRGTCDSSSPSTSASSPSSADSPPLYLAPNEQHPFCILLDLLRRSWAINAETIFKNLDIELFGLYCNIDWDLCSLGLPATELNAARQWFNRIEAQRELSLATAARTEESGYVHLDHGIAHEQMPPLALDMSSDLPEEFEKLRANSIAAIRKDWDTIIQKSTDFKGDNTIPIRMLAVLVSANVLQWPTTTIYSDAASTGSTEVPRMHAGFIAGAIRTSLDLNRNECIEHTAHNPNVIESIRATIALSEYAYGKTDPRVVRELWSLQDAFSVAGDREKARETEKDAFDRLNKYVHNIPLSCA